MIAASKRASGILLHPTSLPGNCGIGDMGDAAYNFADFLASAGQKLWQMLPLGPTGYGNSPYQSLSVFAGNQLLISLERLVQEGFLEKTDLDNVPPFTQDEVNYNDVAAFKIPLLNKSCQLFLEQATTAQREQFQLFIREQAEWLEDYALYMALREEHNFTSWNTWEPDIRARQPEAMSAWRVTLGPKITCYCYRQFQFFKQWTGLKDYCNSKNIQLIGDIPIFVSYDSAEVWSHPEMFYLDEEGKPTVVAGVPPDYFSKTGQLWGNPLYRWDIMASNGYAWWIERFRRQRELVDIIRLDHFRGFEKYYEIPGDATTAVHGKWMLGPGANLFATLKQKLGELPIIVEDLGLITKEVEALRDQFGLPGMRVLQFCFGIDPGSEPYRPYNFPRNCVVYTGTHDNNTTMGWFNDYASETATMPIEQLEKERELARSYMGTDCTEVNWDFIRVALESNANMAIVPLQDVLGLGSEARMNTPGTTAGNWRWRFRADMLTPETAERLKKMTAVYGR